MRLADKLEKFMEESNKIEGENILNPQDYTVAQTAYIDGFLNLDEVTKIHGQLTNHLNAEWSGKWRKVNVRVGNFIAPDWFDVPELMNEYWAKFDDMNSWEAHNEFEKIHPFLDFNGRMGRLIWLSKAVKEGYNFSIPFLQKYYYQTLDKTNE